MKCKSLQKRNKPLASFPEPGISFSHFFFFFFFFALCHVESSWYPLQRKLGVLTPGSPVESRNIFLKDLKYNQQRRQLSISMSTGRWQPDLYTSLDSSCKTTICIKEIHFSLAKSYLSNYRWSSQQPSEYGMSYVWQWDFPGGSDSKEPICNAGDLGSIPGSGYFPEEGNANPL